MAVTSLSGQPLTRIPIDEVPVYSQLQPGDDGYINPNNIWVLLGSSEFTGVPARIVALSGINSYSMAHSEQDVVTGLTSRTFTRAFNVAFTIEPVGSIDVYYMVEIETGKWIKQNVQFYYPSASWLTVNGFTFVIDDESVTEELLPTLVVKYKFD